MKKNKSAQTKQITTHKEGLQAVNMLTDRKTDQSLHVQISLKTVRRTPDLKLPIVLHNYRHYQDYKSCDHIVPVPPSG